VATTAGEAVSEPSTEEDAFEAFAAFAALRETIVAIISTEKCGTKIYFYILML